jgi:putative acetyltransferase
VGHDLDAPPVGRVRPVRHDDGDALVRLVGGVYAEYPGCVLDLPGVDADLPRMRGHIADLGGEFWVVTDDAEVVACAGWAPQAVGDAPGAELKRLYVRADRRGRGLGAWLVRRVEAAARRHGAERVELWSDTRFADAHRLYTRLGYAPTGETRDLHDPSRTTEYRFVRTLSGYGA